MTRTATTSAHALPPVTIRESRLDDRLALTRLAGRDSRRLPHGRLLVGEAEGELIAAVPVAGGEAIADPFRPTASLVALLELRATQLRRTDRDGLATAPAPAWARRPTRRAAAV